MSIASAIGEQMVRSLVAIFINGLIIGFLIGGGLAWRLL